MSWITGYKQINDLPVVQLHKHFVQNAGRETHLFVGYCPVGILLYNTSDFFLEDNSISTC
jgi:hypothetical protein